MTARILPLNACRDPCLVGGKAAGLARLLKAGFPVPSGVCLTTAAQTQAMHAAGIRLEDVHRAAVAATEPDRARLLEEVSARIRTLPLPARLMQELRTALLNAEPAHTADIRWAVRSSAISEDTAQRSYAGLYRSRLSMATEELEEAIRECWASAWTTTVLRYAGPSLWNPTMAVIVQRMVDPRAAGVAYSRHPVTHATDRILINAVSGLATGLVDGSITPESFTVRIIEHGSRGSGAEYAIESRSPGTGRSGARGGATLALTDEQTVDVARAVHAVARAFEHPVDVEWALDQAGLWLLQARAITVGPTRTSRPHEVWSRANFKETLPDVPSPLGLSFLSEFMEHSMLRHYRHLGCVIPEGARPIRVIDGRPYINITLFQVLAAQLGGDASLVTEHMGGPPVPPPATAALPWWKLLRAWALVQRHIHRAIRTAPAWFAAMKREPAQVPGEERTLTPEDILRALERIGTQLSSRDITFAAVAGVSQAQFMLRTLLARRVGDGWRAELNAALRGAGQVISAGPIQRLRALAQLAREDRRVSRWFTATDWHPAEFRSQLAHSTFLAAFEAYLIEYGHRAMGESDVMTPRFIERPEPLLTMIRTYVMSASGEDPVQDASECAASSARARIRRAFGWRLHERLLFERAYRRLVAAVSLRESNRHHLMYLTTAIRRWCLHLGRYCAARGILTTPEDIFFLKADELNDLVTHPHTRWRPVVEARRAAHAAARQRQAPDTVGAEVLLPAAGPLRSHWHGLPFSAGKARGPARLVHSSRDYQRVHPGDIVVTSVIDPGMVPLFGLSAGLIAELGGVLSHGAIIVREYGLPAVGNVPGIMTEIPEGTLVEVDADTGVIRLVAPATVTSAIS